LDVKNSRAATGKALCWYSNINTQLIWYVTHHRQE